MHGHEIHSWILTHVESNEKRANHICQKMLEKEFISNVDSKLNFSNTDLYRLYTDNEDIANNMLFRWKERANFALDVSSNLVKMVDAAYN